MDTIFRVKPAACIAGAAFLLLPFALAAQQQPADSHDLRINQIQVIGTHNSYHAGLLPGVAKVLQQNYPDVYATLDYKHSALDVQLEHGIRQIELDIVVDSKGGRYATPFGPAEVAKAGLPADPKPYPDAVMQKPGFKMMHVQDIDYVSTCQPFVACLQIVRQWSEAHPRHIPIFISVEPKQDTPDAKMPWVTPEPFTPEAFDALDAEIRSVFPANEIITPDQVRGRAQTLNDAILHNGWPTLEEARGKVIFLLLTRQDVPAYLHGHDGLRGHVLFTNSPSGRPESAYVEESDEGQAATTSLVRAGYLVRARADADTVEARSNDVRPRDRAFASGAQLISTDYPAFEPSRWTGYFVALPGGASARCNPINAPAVCNNTSFANENSPQ